MSEWVVVRLDTEAPSITWGPVDGAVASEVLSLPYLLNEGSVSSATLELSDGRQLVMQVLSDRLRVQLPDDASDGPATVRANVVDDVLNVATRTHYVDISGTPVIQPDQPDYSAGGLPRPPVRTREHVSVATVHSRYRTAAAVGLRSVARLRSRYSSQLPRTINHSARARGDVHHEASTLHSWGDVATSASSYSFERRPEGPDAEDELILFDLL